MALWRKMNDGCYASDQANGFILPAAIIPRSRTLSKPWYKNKRFLIYLVIIVVTVLTAFCSFELFFVNVLVRITGIVAMKDFCRDFHLGILLVGTSTTVRNESDDPTKRNKTKRTSWERTGTMSGGISTRFTILIPVETIASYFV
jgi:hypothetical protein